MRFKGLNTTVVHQQKFNGVTNVGGLKGFVYIKLLTNVARIRTSKLVLDVAS